MLEIVQLLLFKFDISYTVKIQLTYKLNIYVTTRGQCIQRRALKMYSEKSIKDLIQQT